MPSFVHVVPESVACLLPARMTQGESRPAPTGIADMNAIAEPRGSSTLAAFFRPDHQRYEGARPIQVLLLRVLYLLS
jgi:hypothetical protein